MTAPPAGPDAPPPGSAASWRLQRRQRWQELAATGLRAYHAYANWLVGISWRRFILLSVALLVAVDMVHDVPPLTWRITEQLPPARRLPSPPPPMSPVAPAAPAAPPDGSDGSVGTDHAPEAGTSIHITKPQSGEGVEIDIGKDGIRIGPKQPPNAARPAASGAEAGVHISLPPGAASDSVRQALEQARREVADAERQARAQVAQARAEAQQARAAAAQAAAELSQADDLPRTRVTRVGIGDALRQFTLLWIVASAIIKYTYKGRLQAEVKAAQATETAEAESLKRQVVEARMAAMQAQVEPHFLFNTLASIDHLIETDPPRASTMQKNLIALLRASMPTMREASGNGSPGVRDLGRELAVIRPYLEILKVRMEERLATEIAVPDGLLSAEFPPMMIQTLVENAIKHGLEPKAEGGRLRLAAEIVHGKLQVTVADTGLGFGKAATAGTGVGLANIRERLQLLYGPKATLTVAANPPGGTVVTITVPYRTVEGAHA
ncbi:MAG: histidine kinase [Burkholderiales bacterium]|nr:histidine kinase [Burkholderiales bacterium]